MGRVQHAPTNIEVIGDPENQHLSKGLGPNLTPRNQYQPMCLFWAGNMETLLNLGSNIALIRSTSLKMEDTLKWWLKHEAPDVEGSDTIRCTMGKIPLVTPEKRLRHPWKCVYICTHNYPYLWTLRGSGSVNKTSMGWQRVSLHVPKQNRMLHQLNGLSIIWCWNKQLFCCNPTVNHPLMWNMLAARSLFQGHPGPYFHTTFPYVRHG